MAQLLLVNPRSRRKARRSPKRTTRARRRRNPIATPAYAMNPRRRRRTARRHNPIGSIRRRVFGRRRIRRGRRSNPIGLGSMSSYVTMLKNALIGGAGSVAIDVLMGQINPHLPASMMRTPGTLGVGDGVKALITIAAGMLLKKPTKGLSVQMAQGALIVQAAEAMRTFVPATMTLAGMGYMSPAMMTTGASRIGPNASRLNAFIPGNSLLSQFVPGGTTLSGRGDAREREGYAFR